MMVEAMEQEGGKGGKLDDIMIISTAFVILLAGYDTTGNTLALILLELARNEEIQDRLRAEIEQAYEDSDKDTLSYETLQGMEYLDMVIHEGLRF